MAVFPMVPVGLVASVLQSNVDKKSKDGEDSVRLLNYTDVYYNDKIDLSHDFMVATASTEQIERLKLQVGDVVITKDSETADDIGIPALVSETADDFVCAYHLSILRPDTSNVTGDYLFWCMKSKPTANYWESRANGVTRVSIPSTTVTSLKLPLPDLETQRRIADYLDAETAQIDALVAELDGYVELLEKRRESLSKEIIDGLTKDFKDVQCKFIVDTTTGSGDTQDATQEGEYPFYVRSDHIESATEWTFDTDAVLTSGDGAGVGKIYHLASGKFHAHQRVYVMRNFRQAIPEYYYWVFKQRFTESIQYGGAKSTVESVRMNMITDLKIPLPDLDTQRRIADYLDEETAKTYAIITQCRELKELLLKRRQVLITDVVTGKVEV